MKKRLLPILLVVLHLLTLGPIWGAGSSASTETRKKTQKKATSSATKPAKKPATKPKPKKQANNATKSKSSKPVISQEQQQALIHNLGMLQEVWERKITLEFISDDRSQEYFKQIIADFPKKIQNNFTENIRGEFKAEFYANYAAKADDLTDQAFALFKDNPALDSAMGGILKKMAFPGDLAFFDLVKKIQQRRKFQVTSGETKLEPLNKYWESVYAQMRTNAKKSRYEALADKYKDVAPKEFPIHWYDDAQHSVFFETEGANPAAPGKQGRKKWTILAFICADNDLERFGLQDINEMETVGSSNDVNVVAQIDRYNGSNGATIADGNWVGTRRYYVTKDDNPAKVTSPMVMNLGETNMGNKNTLADFLKWGVSTYPADNVVVVVWNHGMGWKGIAHDEESDEYMRIEDVAWALREGQKELSKVNQKASKFAIVDFDACLMGTLEVAYEISDSTEFMVASQENEPGQGMPYGDYLAPLVKNPALSPREFTKRMVGTYVQSYAKGGSQTNKFVQGSPVTKSATDLSKIPALVKKIDTLGKALLADHKTYSELLVSESGMFASVKRYSDNTLVDLVDFAVKLAQMPNAPSNIRGMAIDIIKTIGYPVENDKLAAPVVITSNQPGVIIWGFNGWRMPPKDLWPPATRVHNSRLAMTQLKQIEKGVWATKIGPFEPVVDEALEKRVFVDEINYQLITADGKAQDKRRIRQPKEHLIVSKFPEHSPMVIEGHTQGMGDSRGLSLYYSPSFNFSTRYKALKFSRDTSWDEFLETTPKFHKEAEVLLCGQMVEDPMTLPVIAKALKDNGVKFQVLWDPSVYGFNFKEILRKFAGKGLVITDSVSASSLGELSPSSDDLIDFLDNGGNLLIAAQSFEQTNIHRNLLKNYFKFTYVNDEKDFDELVVKGKNGDFNVVLNGSESAKTASDVTIMKVGNPGKLLVTMPDGSGAGIFVSDESRLGKNYLALYLGFRLEAVGDTEARNKLMSEILDRLMPDRHQLSLF